MINAGTWHFFQTISIEGIGPASLKDSVASPVETGMDDDWPARIARLLLVAWALLVLTLFAIAVARQRPERPGAKAKHSDQPMTETAPGRPAPCGR